MLPDHNTGCRSGASDALDSPCSAVMSTKGETGGHELRAEFQIAGEHSDHYFAQLHEKRDGFNGRHDFSEELAWRNPTDVALRRVYWRLDTDFEDPDLRTRQHRWLAGPHRSAPPHLRSRDPEALRTGIGRVADQFHQWRAATSDRGEVGGPESSEPGHWTWCHLGRSNLASCGGQG